MSSVLKWTLKPAGDGSWVGTITLPMQPGALIPGAGPALQQVAAKAATPKQAIGKAAALMDQALSNPLVQAILPPQAALAINAVKGIASGKVGKLVGPGAKRLGKALGKLF